MIKKGFQSDIEFLEGAKYEILQEVSELRDAYMINKSSHKGIRPLVAVIDGRSIPTWLTEDAENSVTIELPTSSVEALMCEYFLNMSDEEVEIFLDVEEQMQPLREKLRIIDSAIDAILIFNESSQF